MDRRQYPLLGRLQQLIRKKGQQPMTKSLAAEPLLGREKPPLDTSKNKKTLFNKQNLFLTAFLVLAMSSENLVQGQTTYTYWGVPTQQLLSDLYFELGPVEKAPNFPGFELNFWALPFFLSSKREPILQICDGLYVTFGFNTSENTIGFGLKSATWEVYDTLPTLSNSIWLNVNLRVMYSNYTLLNVWQGNNWYELDPSLKALKLLKDTTFMETNTSMIIKKTSSSLGAYLADFRLLKINQTDSYGQFLRHYEMPFNNRWSNTLNYMFIREGFFNLQPSLATSYSVQSYTLKKMDVLRCNQSMAMQADGTCSMNCLTSKCLFCQTIDKQYYNICRFCDGVSSSCQPISKCPTDYYLEYGVCYKCPIGCSSCTRDDLCTSCDSGLVLNQFKNMTTIINAMGIPEDVQIIVNATCDCPIGQFGTAIYSLDSVTCAKCDETCRTCQDTNVKCTTCSAPLFWIDIDGGMCVGSCSDMIPNYFGDTSDRVCKPCASNCKKCTSLTGCTECDNYNSTALVSQQKKDGDGIGLVDENGQPIMESVNVTTVKKLLNAEGVCMQTCPTNSIDNSTFFMCHMCPNECTTCSEISSNCTSCNVSLGSLYTIQNSSYTPAKSYGRCLAKCPNGYFSDNNICKQCDQSCTVCEQLNFCTNCTMIAPDQLYHFVNYQCKLLCGERYYPDHSDPSFYFCRSCPSNCLQCSSARHCTSCVNDYFLTNINGYQLCVLAKDCAEGSFADGQAGSCLPCISDCKKCSGSVGCSECFDGFFLNNNLCINRCPTGKFADPSGACTNCIANCDECGDTLSCKTCSTGYVLLEDNAQCVSGVTCPDGYFLSSQNNCTLCKPECEKCTSATVCTACILGHTLKGTNCENNCGNGIREDVEYCDDGNNDNEDGCLSDCTVQSGFVCEQGVLAVGATTAPDVCRCDPSLRTAQWTDYWGTIQIVFDSSIYYNTAFPSKSDIPLTFCQQILQDSTLTRLGTSYACYLTNVGGTSKLIIEVDKDAVIGNKNESYDTSINLIENAIMVQGCKNTGIPINYKVMNLPLDTPQVLFTSSIGSNQIGLCANDITLNLATSKGLTKRNVDATWTLISLTPADDNLKELLQTNLDNTFKGVSFYTIFKQYIELLKGKTVSIQAMVTNFLGRSSKNTTQLTFLNQKRIDIIDLPDTIAFQPNIANRLYPRFRLPYCTIDSTSTLSSDYANIYYTCDMFDVALTTKVWPLTNCTIPANNMSLTTQYIVRLTANIQGDATYQTIKNVFVQPSSPPIQVALIQGCNRVFSPNNSFSLSAIYNTNPNSTTFVWECTDKATGSVCFSTNYQFITLGNSETITVGKDIFFFGMQYEFKVTAFDSASATNSSITCTMYSSGPKDLIIDVLIIGEATQTGFIDFTRQQTAFKAFVSNMEIVKQATLTYQWQIYDSSGKIFSDSEVNIYQNSIGLSTNIMNRNSDYYVVVKVSDGKSWGNATQILRTKPDISNEFAAEPSDREPKALSTVFSLSVYSQKTFASLDQYVFGYIDPSDGVTKIAMTQKSYKKFSKFILPEPTTGSSITCYVDVIMPNRVSMTYYKTVSLSPSDITVTAFMDETTTAVMDDIVESMQMKHKLVSLRSKMTVTQRNVVINKILEGLQKETTPLSDYYIQSSVGSLLEYISKESESLLSDANIVNTAAKIFKQLSIDENSDLANGKSLKFGMAITSSLYNFANNLFQKDFTNLIGGPQQLEMKVMFMQGLKNVLKGSLSNMILGDAGGFSYQGQNIYAKALKFDTLETQFKINATLPKSISSGNLTQNFVNITLPPATSSSNPCKNYKACQVSIIIIDKPITNFISNSKDSSLKSMLVEMSISSTEVTSPNPTIQISEINVQGLTDPILMTLGLYSALDTTNPNNTFACGYIDPQDQIFKQTGVEIEVIKDKLVTCMAKHLTQIAVEQFSQDKSTTTNQEEITKTSSQQNVTQSDAVEVINMWQSWAIYASFSLPGIMAIGIFWARKKDLKDEGNLQKIQKAQKKIYVHLYLEAIPEIQKKEPDVVKKRNQNLDDYEIIGKANNETAQKPASDPNKDFFNDNKGAEVKGFDEPKKKEASFLPPINVDLDAGSQKSKASGKKKVKKKKKKVAVIDPIEQDLFFEGGQSSSQETEQFEGGDDDDFFAVADAEESARLSGKKKKKKKKSGPSHPKIMALEDPEEPALPQIGRGRLRGPVEEINLDEDSKSQRSKKSSRSRSKSKTLKSKKVKGGDDLDVMSARSGQSKMRGSNFGGFNFNEGDGASQKSKTPSKLSRGKKKKKVKRSTSKASSAAEEEEVEERPDFEAEEIAPKKKRKKPTKKAQNNNDDVVEILGPQENLVTDNGANAEDLANNTLNRQDTQSKGFETLMNEELEKAKNELKGKKKHIALKKKKEEKKKKAYFEKEAATCIQFCIWNCGEGHRCLSLFKYYNQYLSRSSRVILMIMSWFMFIMITGILVEGNQFIAPKSVKTEQFACGTVAALIARIWVVAVTGFLMHSKREKIYQEIISAERAQTRVCLNTVRYYFGLILVFITILICYIQVFSFAARFTSGIGSAWLWSFIFAIFSDLVVADGVFISLATLLTMTVGAAPDACGKFRNCWLNCVPQAIKDAAE